MEFSRHRRFVAALAVTQTDPNGFTLTVTYTIVLQNNSALLPYIVYAQTPVTVQVVGICASASAAYAMTGHGNDLGWVTPIDVPEDIRRMEYLPPVAAPLTCIS